jgi:hypothetical protein
MKSQFTELLCPTASFGSIYILSWLFVAIVLVFTEKHTPRVLQAIACRNVLEDLLRHGWRFYTEAYSRVLSSSNELRQNEGQLIT